MTPSAPLILLDVGSTNSRAWLVDDGRIVDRRTAAVGVRDSARDGSTARVRATVNDLVMALQREGVTVRVAAAGMITSPLGLAEVPHVLAPAAVEDLAKGAVEVEVPGTAHGRILLVPGVRTAGGADDGVTEDVMRGEETLVVGLLAMGVLTPGAALLNAGSHWKLIQTDDTGRIASSRTSLGGEVVHAVQSATLLAASLPPGPLAAVDAEWLEAGRRASQRDGLLRALFDVRLLDQRGTTSPAQRFSWLAGACIADDLQALLRTGALKPGMRVTVTGPGAIPQAWQHLLRQESIDAAVLGPDVVEQAFIDGLTAIARTWQPAS